MATSASSPTAGENSDTTPGGSDVPKTDIEAQFPGEVAYAAPEEAPAVEEEPKGKRGSVWAKYTGSSVHERGLTLKDQTDSIGVPKTKVTDNSADAVQAGRTLPLEPGIWFTPANRFRVDVTDVHPKLLEYLEEDDPNFEIKRY